MNKYLLALICITFLQSCQKEISGESSSSEVPPVIESGSVISSLTANTKADGYWVDSGFVAVPDSGSKLRFDYSTLSDTRLWSDSIKQPANRVDFPSASYMTGINQNIAGQNFAANQYFSVSTSKWSNLGIYYSPELDFNFSGYGIKIPQQASLLTPSQTLVNFPIQFKDSINQSTSSNFSIQITATVAGFPITGPINIAKNTTINSRNTSYGILKLKGYADSLQVVVQKYTTQTAISVSSSNFIINSLLPTLLTQIGITNNQTIESTIYRFWAKGKGLVMTREANGAAFIRKNL